MTLVLAIDSLDVLVQILPLRVWVWLVAAGLLLIAAIVVLWLRVRREAHQEALRTVQQARTTAPAGRVAASPASAGPSFDMFEKPAGAHTAVFACRSELQERRPLSEAQWDSDVPAAWTIFRLTPEDAGNSPFHLGLLLPIREPKAFSSGFLERLEGSDPEPVLRGFARALAGPVPPPEVAGSEGEFLEFKTYVDNEHPAIIPGSLDRGAANYWIFVQVFVQDTLVFYMRLNVARERAEVATNNPAHGEELLRLMAATLRAPVAGG